MSANVWFYEVNKALITEILNSVKVRNEVDSLVPLDPVHGVIIRKPEEDLKFESFPCVSIYNVTYSHDSFRYNRNPVAVSRDEVQKTVTMEDSAVPFNLLVQLDFWSQYQEDMDDMTRTWLIKHFRQFNLRVEDDGGTERFCNAVIQGNAVKSDLLEKNDRMFHTTISYSIWVELDDETRYNVGMVTERTIDTN